jgi:predicted phosphodiesterase
VRTALFSDVHGNAVALDAMLADADGRADRFVCLGDAAQGGAQPAEVLDRLAELGCPVVLGNADAFLLDPTVGETPATEELLQVRRWSLARLEARRVAQIEAFAPLLELDLDGRTLVAFHGWPTDYDGILLPWTSEEELRAALGNRTADLYAGGHVHQQFLRRVGGGQFVNPGSVGLSWDWNQPHDDLRFDPFACYAIVSDVSVEFRRVPYDVETVVAAIGASGRPHGDEFAAQFRPRAI